MKNIKKENLRQLLEIIPNKPAQRILHFCANDDTLIEHLSTYTKEKAYEYQILCASRLCFDKNQDKYKNISHISILNFPPSSSLKKDFKRRKPYI